MRALLFVCLGIVSAICVNRRTYAGPWSTEPVVGVAAEYASNPELLAANPQSETHAAVIVDVPVNYDLDDVHFAIIPRVRYSDATGYSSVTSNYFHLDTSAKYTDELGSIGLSGAAYRDSSLLYAGEVANGVGVRRDTTIGRRKLAAFVFRTAPVADRCEYSAHAVFAKRCADQPG